MEQRLQQSTLANDVMLNYRHITQYHRKSGFQVSVDGALHLAAKLPAFALHSVAPPAPFYTLYGRNRIAGDVNFTRQFDTGSAVVSPRWFDDYTAYTDVRPRPVWRPSPAPEGLWTSRSHSHETTTIGETTYLT